MTGLFPPTCALCDQASEDYCRICRKDLCFRHALAHEPDPYGGACKDTT